MSINNAHEALDRRIETSNHINDEVDSSDKCACRRELEMISEQKRLMEAFELDIPD